MKKEKKKKTKKRTAKKNNISSRLMVRAREETCHFVFQSCLSYKSHHYLSSIIIYHYYFIYPDFCLYLYHFVLSLFFAPFFGFFPSHSFLID